MSVRTSVVLLFAGCFMGPATLVFAQQPPTTEAGKWEIEVHGGGGTAPKTTGGRGGLPGAGGKITHSPRGPPPRRAHAYSPRATPPCFCRAAGLFNQVASDLAASGVAQFPGRITTLDPVLGKSLGEWRRGGNIGVRVSRELTPRLSAEVSVDYNLAPNQMTQANSDAIEATRAS